MTDLIYDCDITRGFLRFGGANAGTPATGIAAVTGAHNSRRIDILVRIRDLPAYWHTLFDGWRRAGTAWPQ